MQVLHLVEYFINYFLSSDALSGSSNGCNIASGSFSKYSPATTISLDFKPLFSIFLYIDPTSDAIIYNDIVFNDGSTTKRSVMMWHLNGNAIAQCQFYDSYIVVNTTYTYDGKTMYYFIFG